MVVATNDGLVGIKPGSNNLLFNFTDYGRVKPEELYFVPNAPYVMIGEAGFIPIATKKAVIDYNVGEKTVQHRGQRLEIGLYLRCDDATKQTGGERPAPGRG